MCACYDLRDWRSQVVNTISPAKNRPSKIPNRTRLISIPNRSPSKIANHMAHSLRDCLACLFIDRFGIECNKVCQ